MTYEAQLRYDEPLIRRAVFAFWKKTVGIGFLIALALVAVGFVPALIRGEASWVTGVCATVFVLGVGLIVAIYVTHFKMAITKFRALGQPAMATFIAADDVLTMSSAVGSSTLNWSMVTEVWRFPGFWLLLFSKSQFVTLPLADMNHDMQVFILDRVRAAGGKVARAPK